MGLTTLRDSSTVPDMSETFTKLFHSILASSIWREDDHTRLVWITMLAMADRNGYVGSSIPGIASMAHVPLEAAAAALEKFLSPDPWSRSTEFEGRRIEVADRGWNILNYDRFRDMRDEEARKEYERDRKRRSRAARSSVPSCPGQVQNVTVGPLPSAHADVEVDVDRDGEVQKKKARDVAVARPPDVSEQVWNDYVSLRKDKRAKLTATALAQLIREAAKAGRTLEDVLTECVTRGWTGFKADWAKDRATTAPKAASGEPDWDKIDYGKNRRI